MPTLFDALQSDSREALRARDDLKLQALRMVLSQAKNLRIEKGAELDDADLLVILQKAIKTRRESVEQFRRGGREDLAGKEEREIAILEAYLPRALTEEETALAVREVIAATGATTRKDMGRVMKELQSRYPGQLDNRLASRLVSEKLVQ